MIIKELLNNSARKKLLYLLLLISASDFAQIGDKLKDGLKYYTDTKDSSHYVKLNVCNQIWARYTENNPYTTIEGKRQSYTSDVSVRRIRLVMTGQITDRVGIYVQFGQNSLNYLTPRKAQSFFHDVTADYAIIKKYFSLGFGLNGWNGPSRFSNTSVSSILVLDPPGYQEVTNDTYDQFVRRLGIYAKGKIGKLDYRISAAKPFVIQTTSGINPIDTTSTFSTLPPQLVYQGYFMYQFLDQESNLGPGTAGTYLGKKKIFNIGAGFYYQDQAMYRYKDRTKKDTLYEPIMLFAVDLFYDAPINKEKGTAFSLYACYSNYNYGQNFIKVSGPDNPATASSYSVASTFNKANFGNAFPYLGTGNVYYLQTAYKFKDNLLKDQGTLQPYVNVQYAMYNRLNDPMLVWDLGLNWLIRGHSSKFTLDYQNRPYFVDDGKGHVKESSRKGQYVLQYQVAF
jgi:hypothetical protein